MHHDNISFCGLYIHGHISDGVISIDLPDNIATAILFGSKRSVNFTEEDFAELKDLILTK